MMQNRYGYIRVSTKNQHTDRQKIALLEKGIDDDHLFTDWQSGADFERPEYKRLLSRLQPEDCILVTSLDRLGRNYQEILEQWNLITHVKKADIIVLDMPLLNTSTSHDSLTGRFLADIVLQILSYVAEIERTNIRKRQAEGIAAAKAKGVAIGRPKRKLPKNYQATVQRIRKGELTYRKAAKELKVSYSWLYKMASAELAEK